MDSDKRELRAAIRAARRGKKFEFDSELLISMAEFKAAEVIASYRSYGDEPSTANLNLTILDSGKVLLLPQSDDEGGINFVKWNGDSNFLKRRGKVEEPIGPTFSGKIDLLIIPSLAADLNGSRLGQGGGAYDRALSKLDSRAITVMTLLNEGELFEKIPTQAHDAKINVILFPNRLIRI